MIHSLISYISTCTFKFHQTNMQSVRLLIKIAYIIVKYFLRCQWDKDYTVWMSLKVE
jgi:hypothetical protein